MKQITTWSPDTCSCVIEYEWDDIDSPETRAHTHHASIKSCPAHSQHYGKAKHYDTVIEENQRKNKALGDIAKILGVSLAVDEDALESERIKVRKFLRDFHYTFDADRNLEVSHPQLTATHKKTLQDKTDLVYGKNKVKVI